MAGKRQATSNLNHDNWDHDEEPEERGTFKTAPPEELKTRVIKKATRRKAGVGGSEADEAATDNPRSSVFSGFSGFGKPAPSATAGVASPFAFLSKVPAAPFTGANTTLKPAATAGKDDDAKWTPPPAKLFSFDLKNDAKSSPLALPTSSTSTKISSGPSIFGNVTAASTAIDATATPKPPTMSMFKAAVSPSVNSGSADNTVSSEYRDSVAELNMAVMKFLQEHMDKNPYCILSPVFNSYEKYLKQIQQKEETTTTASSLKATVTQSTPATAVVTSSPLEGFSFGKPTTSIGNSSTSPSISFGKKPNCTVTSGGTTTTVTAPLFSFGNVPKANTSPAKSESTTNASTSAASSIFSFGMKPATSVANKEDAPKPSFFSFGTKDASSSEASAALSPPKTNGFSFGLKSDDKPSTSGFSGFGKPSTDTMLPPSTGFSFGSTSTTPFSFGNLKPPSPLAGAGGGDGPDAVDDEEDRPPKVEFKQVVEDDAIFSKRCKVFVKKDKDFSDRGIGTLYLKPVKDSEKTQLLVRADTNLGKILINLILIEGIPSQRMGKNNVMMVCVPTPEETKPLSILLRVKTGEEADELLKQIKKHTV